MTRLPVVSGRELISALERAGYEQDSSRLIDDGLLIGASQVDWTEVERVELDGEEMTIFFTNPHHVFGTKVRVSIRPTEREMVLSKIPPARFTPSSRRPRSTRPPSANPRRGARCPFVGRCRP